jgi:large subunit ribosomal protein L25
VSETALVVETREGTGKGVARKLRAAGRIPALLDLTVQGRSDLGQPVALVKELQRDPIRGAILHADLYQVDLTKTVEVEVPIHLLGKPKGLDFGGLLEHTLREVALECLPRAIPAAIEVDVSNLEIGDVIHVRDLALPQGVTLVSDPDLGVAHVALPQVEEAPAEVAAVEGVPAEGAAAAPAAEGAEKTTEKKTEKAEKKGE